MVRRAMVALALYAALAPALFGSSPARITFVRTIRPPHELGTDQVAVVYALGDTDKVMTFVDHFVQYAGRSGALRIEDAIDNRRHLAAFSQKELRSLRHDHPAGAYIGISLFTCAGAERRGEVSETTLSGDRVRSKMHWLDAICSAKLDIRKPDGKQMLTFMTHGEGTSPRVRMLTDDDRDIAYEQATRYAAITAAEEIVPRETRESIELDDRAPAFDDAVAMINSDRFADARAIWEASLARHRNSAPLQYNLGAVCEAMGDLSAAENYYRNAARIAPQDARYRTELNFFRKRNSLERAGSRH